MIQVASIMPRNQPHPPPVPALSTDISVVTQRELRKIGSLANENHEQVNGTDKKVAAALTDADLDRISQHVRQQLQSTGKYPLNITALQGVVGQPQPAALFGLSAFPDPSSNYTQNRLTIVVNGAIYTYNAVTNTWEGVGGALPNVIISHP